MRRLRRRWQATVGGIVVVAGLSALLLMVVVPALATTTATWTWVAPSQTAGYNLTPVLLANGGQDNDCSAFYGVSSNSDGTVTTPTSNGSKRLYQIYIDNPKLGLTVTDPVTKATFTPTVDSSGKFLSFTSTGAAVVDVGINGGKQSTVYNYDGYVGNPPPGYPPPSYPGSVTSDNNLHAPVQKTTGSASNPNYTFYSVSHIAFCYQVVATVSGTVYTDPDGNQSTSTTTPLTGATVTLYDTSNPAATPQTATTSGSSAPNYTFSNVPAGDGYVLCVSTSGGTYTETAPTSPTPTQCSSGAYKGGNVITKLDSGNGANQNFFLRPWGSVSGTVFNDLNQNGNNDDSSPAGPQSGWTVTLYDGSGTSVGTPQTTSGDGKYSFSNQLDPSKQYTLCEAAPSGTWNQTAPDPSSPNSCANLGSSNPTKGYVLSSSSSGWPTMQRNFGNTAGTTCPTDGSPITYHGSNGIVYKLFSCKDGQVYSFLSGTEPGDAPIAAGNPFVSVFPGDTTVGTMQPTMEYVLLPDPIVSGANGRQPTFRGLAYTDTFHPTSASDPLTGYSVADLKPVQECQVDPSDASNGNPGTLVNTATSGILPSGEGSCFVSIKTYVDSSGNGWLEAYTYTEIDGHYAGY